MTLLGRSPVGPCIRLISRRRTGVGCFALLGALLVAAAADAAERIALVIGIGAYAHVSSLDHVANDMLVMADTLRQLDFDVETAADLDRTGLQEQLSHFNQRLDRAGGDAIGVLFYAGYGLNVDGTNYLLPVDAAPDAEADPAGLALDFDLVLAELAFAPSDVKLIIMDVPAEEAVLGGIEGAAAGLAAVDAPVGTLVAYGNMPDRSASKPPYEGLYPLALAAGLTEPGLTVEEVFQKVRLNVAEATDGAQLPWEAAALLRPLRLAGAEPVLDPVAATPQDRIDHRTADLVAWMESKDSADPADLEAYLDRFPDGLFRALAESRLADGEPAGADADVAAALVVAAKELTLITQKRANVSAAPGRKGVIVATLDRGREVRVSGEAAGGEWYRVALVDDVQGFVPAALLGTKPPPDGSLDFTDLAATQPPSMGALLGRWQGEYRCQWDTIGLALEIESEPDAPQDGAINAVFSFFPLPGSIAVPRGSFDMTGHYDPQDGALRLRSSRWIDRPFGGERHDIAGRVEPGGAEISGQVETTGCTDFVLTRDTRPGLATVHSITAN
jgi:uncharacterized caspase-like protein